MFIEIFPVTLQNGGLAPIPPNMKQIRNIATFSILGQMSSLKHTSCNRCQRIYNDKVERLMLYYYPPYRPPTLGDRFMSWLDNLAC